MTTLTFFVFLLLVCLSTPPAAAAPPLTPFPVVRQLPLSTVCGSVAVTPPPSSLIAWLERPEGKLSNSLLHLVNSTTGKELPTSPIDLNHALSHEPLKFPLLLMQLRADGVGRLYATELRNRAVLTLHLNGSLISTLLNVDVTDALSLDVSPDGRYLSINAQAAQDAPPSICVYDTAGSNLTATILTGEQNSAVALLPGPPSRAVVAHVKASQHAGEPVRLSTYDLDDARLSSSLPLPPFPESFPAVVGVSEFHSLGSSLYALSGDTSEPGVSYLCFLHLNDTNATASLLDCDMQAAYQGGYGAMTLDWMGHIVVLDQGDRSISIIAAPHPQPAPINAASSSSSSLSSSFFSSSYPSSPSSSASASSSPSPSSIPSSSSSFTTSSSYPSSPPSSSPSLSSSSSSSSSPSHSSSPSPSSLSSSPSSSSSSFASTSTPALSSPSAVSSTGAAESASSAWGVGTLALSIALVGVVALVLLCLLWRSRTERKSRSSARRVKALPQDAKSPMLLHCQLEPSEVEGVARRPPSGDHFDV